MPKFQGTAYLSGSYSLTVEAENEDEARESIEAKARELFSEGADFDVPEGEEDGLTVEADDLEEVDENEEDNDEDNEDDSEEPASDEDDDYNHEVDEE